METKANLEAKFNRQVGN